MYKITPPRAVRGAKFYLPALDYGVGEEGTGFGAGAGVPVGTAAGVGVILGGVGANVGKIVGTSNVAGAAWGVNEPPENKTTVPSTMLNATKAFSPVVAYHRQSLLLGFGFARLGIPCSQKISRQDYIIVLVENKSSELTDSRRSPIIRFREIARCVRQKT